MKRFAGLIGLTAIVAGVLVAGGHPRPAAAATPAGRIAYVREGRVYVSDGSNQRALTTDSDDSRPRWSPNGSQIAYHHGAGIWVMNADGSAKRQLTSASGGPSWSPDGTSIAFSAAGCTGGPVVFRVPVAGGAPAALFPTECRGTAPSGVAPAATVGADLAARLRVDDSVAWSPDGASIAFRGGQCVAVYDDCLSVGDVSSGDERMVAGFGGGGEVFSGFAVVPAWSPDGQHLSYTSSQNGNNAQSTTPVHVVQVSPTGGTQQQIGMPNDREMVYLNARTGLLTGQRNGAAWVIAVDLTTGARTPLFPGSQPAVVQP